MSDVLTLKDWAARKDPDGSTSKIVEILAKDNDMVKDIRFVEGNLPTGHRTTVRTSLPRGKFRAINQGVPSVKSTTKQIDEACGMLEAYGKTDKDLVELNGNSADFRLSEEKGVILGLSEQMAETVLYGNNKADPLSFNGLFTRYNDLQGEHAEQIVNAGGTGDFNSSIALVGWGDDGTFGIFPKGSKAGLQVNDKGLQTVTDDNGDEYEAYRTHYQWKAGLVVRDPGNNARICNINMAQLENVLTGDGSMAANLVDMMIIAKSKIKRPTGLQLRWYVNSEVKSLLSILLLRKHNTFLTLKDFEGEMNVLMFDGIPVRTCGKIVNTESALIKA